MAARSHLVENSSWTSNHSGKRHLADIFLHYDGGIICRSDVSKTINIIMMDKKHCRSQAKYERLHLGWTIPLIFKRTMWRAWNKMAFFYSYSTTATPPLSIAEPLLGLSPINIHKEINLKPEPFNSSLCAVLCCTRKKKTPPESVTSYVSLTIL